MPDLGGFPGPDTGSGYGSENEIAVLDPSYFEPTKDKMPTNINVLPVVPKGELDENPGATYEVWSESLMMMPYVCCVLVDVSFSIDWVYLCLWNIDTTFDLALICRRSHFHQ